MPTYNYQLIPAAEMIDITATTRFFYTLKETVGALLISHA